MLLWLRNFPTDRSEFASVSDLSEVTTISSNGVDRVCLNYDMSDEIPLNQPLQAATTAETQALPSPDGYKRKKGAPLVPAAQKVELELSNLAVEQAPPVRVKCTQVQLQQRLEQCMQWQIESVPTYEIYKRGIRLWGVHHRQIQKYIEICNKRWEKEFQEVVGSLRVKLMTRMESLTNKMESSGDFRGASAAVKMLADISGISKQTLELSGPGGKPIQAESVVKVLYLPEPEDKPA